ncbi:uncharacterized protein LOC144121139 isoform X1 [Amblyomma americanum]
MKQVYLSYYATPVLVGALCNIMPSSVPTALLHDLSRMLFSKLQRNVFANHSKPRLSPLLRSVTCGVGQERSIALASARTTRDERRLLTTVTARMGRRNNEESEVCKTSLFLLWLYLNDYPVQRTTTSPRRSLN